jgi:hypothetical protein
MRRQSRKGTPSIARIRNSATNPLSLTFDDLDPEVERIVWPIAVSPERTEEENGQYRNWEIDMMVRKSLTAHAYKRYATALGRYASCNRRACRRLGRCSTLRPRGSKGWDWEWGIVMPACVIPEDYVDFDEAARPAVDAWMRHQLALAKTRRRRAP